MITNKSILSDNTRDNISNCKVIIDNCSHSNQLGINFKEIKSSLSKIFPDIQIIKSICDKPEQLSEIFSKTQSKNAVIIGYGNKEHISKYKKVDLSTVPPSQIQIVDIRLFNVYQKNIDAFNLNVYLAAIQATLASDLKLKPIHKPFKLDNKVSRRNLFRAASTTLEEYTDVPIFQKSLCGALINSCPYCVDSCPYNAVTKEGSNIIISEESCVKCGACCVSCPTGALQLPDLTDNQMITILEHIVSKESTINNTRIIFTCNQSNANITNLPQDTAIIQIPCISVLGFTHAMLAASYGIDIIALCPNNLCKQKETIKITRAEISLANKILQESNTPFSTVKLIEAEKLENIPSLLNEILEQPASIQKSPSIEILSKRPLLISMLSELVPNIEKTFEQKISPFFDIDIDDKLCTMCDACSSICPADALKSIPTESSLELTFRPKKCVGCYACEKVCPEICLIIKGRLVPKNIVDDKKDIKIKDLALKCKKCGKPIGSSRKTKKIEKILAPSSNTSLLEALYLCNKCKSPF